MLHMHDNVENFEQLLFFFYVPSYPKWFRKCVVTEEAAALFSLVAWNLQTVLISSLILSLEALKQFL